MPTAPATKSAGPATVIPVEKDFEFSDMSAMTCLLCARKFKSQDQLDRHNKESDLHKARFPQHCVYIFEAGLTHTCSFFPFLHYPGNPTEKLQESQFEGCCPTESRSR